MGLDQELQRRWSEPSGRVGEEDGLRPEIGEENGLVKWGRRGRWIETRKSRKEIAETGRNIRG